MRQYHPDRQDSEASTHFCAMLNDIYEVLKSEERRMLYGVCGGWGGGSRWERGALGFAAG